MSLLSQQEIEEKWRNVASVKPNDLGVNGMILNISSWLKRNVNKSTNKRLFGQGKELGDFDGTSHPHVDIEFWDRENGSCQIKSGEIEESNN